MSHTSNVAITYFETKNIFIKSSGEKIIYIRQRLPLLNIKLNEFFTIWNMVKSVEPLPNNIATDFSTGRKSSTAFCCYRSNL